MMTARIIIFENGIIVSVINVRILSLSVSIIYPYFAIEEYTTEDVVTIEYKDPYLVLVL